MKTYNIDNKQYTTTKELADHLGLSKIAINKRIERGKLKGFKIGNVYLVEIDNIIEG